MSVIPHKNHMASDQGFREVSRTVDRKTPGQRAVASSFDNYITVIVKENASDLGLRLNRTPKSGI